MTKDLAPDILGLHCSFKACKIVSLLPYICVSLILGHKYQGNECYGIGIVGRIGSNDCAVMPGETEMGLRSLLCLFVALYVCAAVKTDAQANAPLVSGQSGGWRQVQPAG